jgi:hypothetical protein
MPPVFINTDNTDKKNKIYIANIVGEASADVEDKMQSMVVKAFEKESDYTTNKVANAKGYTLEFKITKFSAAAHETSCTIQGLILRYPASYSKSKQGGGSGEDVVMFAGNWTSSATASGKGPRAALDCVEAIMEGMVPKSFPVMKADMTRR